MRFTLFIEPTGQARPRFSKWGTYKSQRQQAHEAELDCQLMCHIPDKPLCGPVSVEFTAFMPIPKSTPKRARAVLTETKTPYAKKPDIDNIEKMLLDRMTALGFWEDDRQVCRVVKEKVYGDTPRWEVSVTEWEQAHG